MISSMTVSQLATGDTAATDAVDLARDALLLDVDAADVGVHLSAEAEGDRVVTHLFACERPGYVGWRWSVTVVRASRAKNVTVDDIVDSSIAGTTP